MIRAPRSTVIRAVAAVARGVAAVIRAVAAVGVSGTGVSVSDTAVARAVAAVTAVMRSLPVHHAARYQCSSYQCMGASLVV